MPLSAEDLQIIQQQAAAGKLGEHELLKPLADLGLVIRTTDEETQFSTNLREQIIGKEELPAYRNIEKTLEELVGEKKKDGEKATDFLKRVVAPMKEGVEKLQAELLTLKEKSDDGDATKADKTRIATLEKMLAEKDTEYQTKLSEKDSALTTYKINTHLNAAVDLIRGMELNVDAAVKDDVIDARIARFKQKYTITESNGQLVVMEGDKELLDPSTLKPKTVLELMKAEFASIIKTPKNKQGSGTGNPGGGAAGATGDYSGVANKQDLMAALKKDGLAYGTKEFDTAFGDAVNAYQKANSKPMPLR